jgi:hypothetical protein
VKLPGDSLLPGRPLPTLYRNNLFAKGLVQVPIHQPTYTESISLRRSDAMNTFFALLLPVIGGMLLLCIGYSYQERPVGVLMIWLGMMSLIGTACFKILEKLT